MKKTIVLLAAAGLSLAACGKGETGSNSSAETGVVANEAGTGDDFAGNSEFTGNSDLLSDNTTLPADEGNETLATDNSATLSNAQ
jgi:hypothetical protein